MRPASLSPDAILFAQLETEVAIAHKHDHAIGRELSAVFHELASATPTEQTWLLALHVGRWRDWNRASATPLQVETAARNVPIAAE